MATNTFGTAVNPAHYIEIPDPLVPGQVKRPAAGTVLKVQNALTLESLPDATAGVYGYFSYVTDVPQIRVSGDGGATWVGPLTSKEAITSSITAGVDATTALANSNTAVSVANTALQLAQSGTGTGGTFSGSVDWLTQVTNRPTIPSTAAQVGALAAGDRGAVNGVAALSGGLVPITQLPVGTSSTQVAQGSHTHAIDFASLPGTTNVRSVIEIDEISAGVYPTLTAAQSRTSIKRVWNGSVRPTVPQGLQPLDKWVNTATGA